jgi:predicted amidophosphoribosyltransferase
MGDMAKALVRALLSVVVPPLCCACREPEFSGQPLCPSCRSRLVGLPEHRCARCGSPAAAPIPRCRECNGRALAFERAWSPFAYETVARTMVAALKSNGALPLAALMGEELAERTPPALLSGTLVPVPAHARRRRSHGFNQAAAIARAIAGRTGLPVRDALARAAPKPPQVGLERRARLANARGSIRLRRGVRAPPRAVLVDDVYTTGATLDACARALLGSGSDRVTAITFARAVRE